MTNSPVNESVVATALLRSDHSPEPGADDRDVAIASGLADHAMKGVVTAILASASNPDLTLLIANETRQS